MSFVREPLSGLCSADTPCPGWYAFAGAYHVISVHPRYRATFTLTDLRARQYASDPPGDPIDGTIVGCVDAPF
jgi:hypothetical protein